MSMISRQLVRDFFRMLEEPMLRPGYGVGRGVIDGQHFGRPALDVREEGNKYVLEAELPGVRKENVEVRIGDGGKSVTIEGKAVEGREGAEGEGSTAVTNAGATDEGGHAIASERAFVHNAAFRRTVWLARAVDSHEVGAKLDHGILFEG